MLKITPFFNFPDLQKEGVYISSEKKMWKKKCKSGTATVRRTATVRTTQPKSRGFPEWLDQSAYTDLSSTVQCYIRMSTALSNLGVPS